MKTIFLSLYYLSIHRLPFESPFQLWNHKLPYVLSGKMHPNFSSYVHDENFSNKGKRPLNMSPKKQHFKPSVSLMAESKDCNPFDFSRTQAWYLPIQHQKPINLWLGVFGRRLKTVKTKWLIWERCALSDWNMQVAVGGWGTMVLHYNLNAGSEMRVATDSGCCRELKMTQ